MCACVRCYPSVQCEQYGVALDVPVDDALSVQVGQRLQDALAHRGDLLLIQPKNGQNTASDASSPAGAQVSLTSCSPGFADDVCESAALQVLHDHPEFLLHQSTAEHLHHVLVPVVPHDHHLGETGEADDVTPL